MKAAAKAAVWRGFAGFVGFLAWSPQARADLAHVENRCPVLSPASYEEIDARVQLLLRSEGGERPLPAVVCTEQGSWLEWEGRRFPIVGRAPIEDEVVDIVEGELHGAARRAEADPRSTEASAIAAGQPMLERGAGSAPRPPASTTPADPVASRPSEARGGGIAVGLQTEVPSETVGVAFGPSFDFGTSVGPLMLGGREAFRVVPGGRNVMLMDFQGTLGFGAPLNPDAHFGLVTRFGAEWMVAYPEGNSGQAAVVPVVDFGVRIANAFRSVSIWGGADAHYRLSTLSLRSMSSLIANDVGFSMSLGVAFVDWSRK